MVVWCEGRKMVGLCEGWRVGGGVRDGRGWGCVRGGGWG